MQSANYKIKNVGAQCTVPNASSPFSKGSEGGLAVGADVQPTHKVKAALVAQLDRA